MINWAELNSTEDELSLLKNQRREGSILDPGPDLGLEAAQGLVEVVTKEVVPNQGAEAVCLHRKIALGDVQGIVFGHLTKYMQLCCPFSVF